MIMTLVDEKTTARERGSAAEVLEQRYNVRTHELQIVLNYHFSCQFTVVPGHLSLSN